MRALLVLFCCCFTVACNCTSNLPPDGGSAGGTAGSGGSGGSTGGGAGGGSAGGSSTFTDFPALPVLDGVDAGTPAQFMSAADAGLAEPCVIEPQDGTLYPSDWLRPRFSFATANGEDVFELTLRAPNQSQPLIVYTTQKRWTMPQLMWSALQTHSADLPLTLDVRGFKSATGELSATKRVNARIAPASAAGSIVYWTTSNGTALRGFRVGAENVTTILTPPQVGNGTQCIGCHTSTPDGEYAGFSASTNIANGNESGIGFGSVDGGAAQPPFISASARTLLSRQQQQAPSFSAGHWAPGDRLALSNLDLGGAGWQITWTDLEAASTDVGVGWGTVNRDGDTGKPGTPVFSHDGRRIVYASAPNVTSGVTVYDAANLWVVPFANRSGGAAAPVAQASDPNVSEAYPSFSPDDALLVFMRVPSGQNSYNNAQGEVWVASSTATSGTAHRVAANDPPACTGQTSPGLTNSWPKWGPTKTTVGARTYYWLTFSSMRGSPRPQLYIAPVVEEGGVLTSYPALYLWNQPADEANHTPAWDVFKIPEIG